MSKDKTDLLKVIGLTIESQVSPLGLDIARPRFSWVLGSAERAITQSAYQLVVTDDIGSELWNTGKVLSDQSLFIVYNGPELQSRRRYEWQVKVWDNQGRETLWSESAYWEMGLLQPADWQAHWIEPVQQEAIQDESITVMEIFNPAFRDQTLEDKAGDLHPPQMLRRSFQARGKVKRARVYATSHGIYRLDLNGTRVGNVEFAPDFTAYNLHLQYQTYDVTDYIQPGENALGAILADGWYLGRIQLSGHSRQFDSGKLALLAQLEMEYEDGSVEIIASDKHFCSHTGPWQYADIFIGEKYDARLEQDGWSSAGFDAAGWQPVQLADYSLDNLCAQYGPSVREMEVRSPLSIIRDENGALIVDFGQIIAGRVRIGIEAEAGTVIRMEHSEVLDKEGRFFMNILGRSKHQTDLYIASGNGREVYEPAFTFHGFRYVRVTGYRAELQLTDIQAVVLYSDMNMTGQFECSDERINQLQSNIQWSQKTNMLSIPTDCPQRERAGWTGDIQVFAPTAAFNMDVGALLSRWLIDVRREQFPDGQIANYVPTGSNYVLETTQMGGLSSAGWGDAIIIVPWVLYQSYGDVRVLEDNYAAMEQWLAYVQRTAEAGVPDSLDTCDDPQRLKRQRYLWNTGFHFGDWLIPSIVMGNGETGGPMASALLTKELVATCCYAYSSSIMAHICDKLGKPEEAERYRELNQNIREAFEAEYVLEDGRITAHFQGIYVLALQMEMVSEARRGLVANQLVGLIEENGNKLDTGFLSIPFLMDVLCSEGRSDVAYRLLYQTECPSWLYEVNNGATTLWESWSAIAPDGEVGHMSFNHYAFGCVGDWMYRYIAGLIKEQPAYKSSRIEPHTDCGLTSAEAQLHTSYGLLASSWLKQGEWIRLNAVVPANTTATIVIPAADEVMLDGTLLDSQQEGVLSINTVHGKLEIIIGSGSYQFEYITMR